MIDVEIKHRLKNRGCMEGTIAYHLQKMYIESTDPSYVSGQVVPAVDILPVNDCFKCPACGYIAPKLDTVRTHITSPPCANHTVQHIRRVKAPSIFCGIKRKLFEVFQDNHPTTGSCIQFNNMRDLQVSNPDDSGANISAMNCFLSVMRFDEHMKAYDFSTEKARIFCFLEYQSKRSSFRKLVSEYHKCDFDITQNKAYIKTHTFPDSTLSLAIDERTINDDDAGASRCN